MPTPPGTFSSPGQRGGVEEAAGEEDVEAGVEEYHARRTWRFLTSSMRSTTRRAHFCPGEGEPGEAGVGTAVEDG